MNPVARTRKAILLAVAVASGSAMAQGGPDDRVDRLQQYEARAAQGDAVAAEQAALMHYHAAPASSATCTASSSTSRWPLQTAARLPS